MIQYYIHYSYYIFYFDAYPLARAAGPEPGLSDCPGCRPLIAADAASPQLSRFPQWPAGPAETEAPAGRRSDGRSPVPPRSPGQS